MLCVGNNNHLSCAIPPACFVSNNVTVLEHNATKWHWFFVVGSKMLFVVNLHLQNTCSLMYWLMMWQNLGSEICVKLILILMPELVRRLVCWLITADNLLTIISPGKDAGFNGILDCRLVLELGAALLCLILCCGLSPFGGVSSLLVVL